MGWGSTKTLATGDRAPAISLVDGKGVARPLRELVSDGAVLLAFFKVSCPTCQLTLPFLNRIAGGTLRVYGVSQDTPEQTARFAREYGVDVPMLYDRDDDNYPASNAFGLTNVPSLFVVESDLRVSYDLVGFHKGDLLSPRQTRRAYDLLRRRPGAGDEGGLRLQELGSRAEPITQGWQDTSVRRTGGPPRWGRRSP